MSVEKTFGFGNQSPYRSDTFNRNNNLIFGRNGVFTLGSVVNSGLNVLIGDIKFIQNGIIISKIGSTSVTFPTDLAAPFYLTASVPDSRQLDNISWSFVRRPRDMGTNTVLLAEWDGYEWRPLPDINVNGLIKHRLSEAIAYKNVGFNSGFRFSPDSIFSKYSILKGQVTDKTGLLVEKKESITFDALDADTEYDRIDAIVWRRWMDADNRIGHLILRPGQTYSGSNIVQNHKTSIGSSSNVNSKPVVLNPSDNTLIVLWVEHYGNNGILKFTKYGEDRTTEVVAPLMVGTGITDFDAVIDAYDKIMIVYIKDDNLYRTAIDTSGVVLIGAAEIDGLINPVSAPVVKVDVLGYFYVMFLYELSPSVRTPYFLQMNNGGTVSIPKKQIINSSSNYSKVHFDINADSECHVAYTNSTANTIEYQVLDEVGTALTGRLTVSDATRYGLVTISGSSRNPIVTVAENNEIFISFEQNKGVGYYGLAVYSPGYTAKFGYKALLKDFESSSENILGHAIHLSWDGHAQMLLKTSTKIFFYNYILPFFATRQLAAFSVNPVASGDFDIKFDRAGSLIQAFTNAQSGSSNNGAPIGSLKFGPDTYGIESSFIAATEVAVPLASVNALVPVPTLQDTFIVTGSVQGNNGNYIITYERMTTIDTISYKVFKSSAAFTAENLGPAVAQFTKLTGNSIYFAKQTPTISYTFQEVKAEELDSDILCVAIKKSNNEFRTWYDESSTSASTGSTRGESFLTSSGPIHFDKDLAGGTLTWSDAIAIREPFRYNYKVAAGTVTGLGENAVLYIKMPQAEFLIEDGDHEGFGAITVTDVSQFVIGKKIFIGDSDSDGIELVVTNIIDATVYVGASTINFTTLRGAYIIPTELTLILGTQNKGALKPDSLGFIDKNIFVIAIRSDNLVQFRNGALTLESGEDGHLGDGPGDDILAYIGASSDADNDPNYSNNFSGAQGESLTTRIGRIDTTAQYEAQNRNVLDFFPTGISFTWNSSTGQLTWTAGDWKLLVPDKGSTPGVAHTINTSTKALTIGENKVAYVDINRSTGAGDLTPIVVNDNALPLAYGNIEHIVIARRLGNDIAIGRAGRFTLANGQTSGDAPATKLIKGGTWSWNSTTGVVAWSSEANIQIADLANTTNRIAAGSATLSADGRVAYISANLIAPGGLLSVNVADIDSMPGNASNIIIASRIGDNVLIGDNLLESGALLKLSQSFTDNMLDLIGFSSNGQSVHTYSSTYYITQSTSHEEAIGAFDLQLHQIANSLADPVDEYSWLADGTTDTFVVGVGGNGDSSITWSSDNGINDLIVFVDGNKKELHRAGTYPIGDGDSDGEFIKTNTTTLRLKPFLLAGAIAGEGRVRITVRPYASGMTNVVAVKDEGTTITAEVKEINFKGMGVTVSESAPGKVDVEITSGSGGGTSSSYVLKPATNNTGTLIPAKKAIRFLPNGAIELSDNTVSGKKNPIAITVVEVPPGTTVEDAVAVGTLIPGVLNGLGFGFNERVFLGQNGDLVNESSIPDTGSLDDAIIQIGEAFGTGTTTTDLIWNKQEYPGI